MIHLKLSIRERTYPCRTILVTLAGVFAIFTACSVGPDYTKPTAQVPESYKELGGWKVAQPRDHLIRGAWWEMLNDPRLNELEEQVNISNQNVAVAEAQFRQARALVWAARAAYFPIATIGLGYTRSSGSTTLNPRTTSRRTTLNDFMLLGDVSWEPDIWGKVRRSVEASKASAQASAADLESVRLLAQTELALDYFQLLALDAQKHLLDETVVAFQKSLQLTKNRYEAGVASKADVLLADTQLKVTQAQAIDIGVQRAQFEHAIATLIGKPASVFSMPFSPLTLAPPTIPVGIPSELLERRPDISAAERRVAAANAQIGVAIAAYYPTVTLIASGGFNSSSVSKWLTWPSRFWSVGPGISETVFDGGLRRAQTTQARAAYDANVALYRQTVLTGFQEVEDNLAALRILEEEATAQDEAVKAARQTLTVALNQYKAGTINYLAVIVIQAALLNNEITAVNIAGRRMTAAMLLIKAIGGGWDVSDLPSAKDLGRKEPKPSQSAESEPRASQPLKNGIDPMK
ncbi:MAG: efflux transporter outer membrane subunit [Thermodesulfobacteriota bacterium]